MKRMHQSPHLAELFVKVGLIAALAAVLLLPTTIRTDGSEGKSADQATPRLKTATGLGKLIFDLGDLLERHIRKEERELFPLFEQHAGEIDAGKIGAEISDILSKRVMQ